MRSIAGVAHENTAWKMSSRTAPKMSGPQMRCVTTASMRSERVSSPASAVWRTTAAATGLIQP